MAKDRQEAEMLDQTFVFALTFGAAAKGLAEKSFPAALTRSGWRAYKGRPAVPQKSAPPPPKKAPEPAPGAPKPAEPKPSGPPAKSR